MSIKRVTSPDVPEPPPERWSNCLVVDGVAYVSGMTARGGDPAAIGAQVKAVGKSCGGCGTGSADEPGTGTGTASDTGTCDGSGRT